MRVFVNGVPQAQGTDYVLHGRELVLSRSPRRSGFGLGRWTAIFLGRIGENDSVDVQYELGGRTMVATGLDIMAPSELIRSGGPARSP